MELKKTIKLCTVGSNYPYEWFVSFWNMIVWASANGYRIDFSFTRGSNIYKARDTAIGANSKVVLNNQPYDYILWIDSDQIFSVDALKACLDADKDIITPMIMTEDGTYSTAMKGSTDICEGLRRMTDDDIKDKKDPIEIENCGFGFTLIKKGVYESIKYPWHAPVFLENGDYCSEDHSFMKKAKANGFKLYCLPNVKVWHIKDIPI